MICSRQIQSEAPRVTTTFRRSHAQGPEPVREIYQQFPGAANNLKTGEVAAWVMNIL